MTGPPDETSDWRRAGVRRRLRCPHCGAENELWLDPERLARSNGVFRVASPCERCGGSMEVRVEAGRGGRFHVFPLR